MPSISDSRKTIEADIPGIEGGRVILWDSLTIGDIEKIQSAENDFTKGVLTLVAMIKSWNLDDEISIENVKKLSVDVMGELMALTSYGRLAKEKAEKGDEAMEEMESEKKTD